MFDERAKKLALEYNASDLLDAFFILEAKFRLKEMFDMSEEDVEKNFSSVADMLSVNNERILSGDVMDEIIQKII